MQTKGFKNDGCYIGMFFFSLWQRHPCAAKSCQLSSAGHFTEIFFCPISTLNVFNAWWTSCYDFAAFMENSLIHIWIVCFIYVPREANEPFPTFSRKSIDCTKKYSSSSFQFERKQENNSLRVIFSCLPFWTLIVTSEKLLEKAIKGTA